MQQISLIMRTLFYIFLFVISLSGLLFVVFSGGREYGITYDFVFIFLIPQYIFGLIFLQTKLIIRFTVPIVTTVVSSGCIWLIAQTEFLDVVNSVVLFCFVLFLPVILVWEITYQILIKCDKFNGKIKNIQL